MERFTKKALCLLLAVLMLLTIAPMTALATESAEDCTPSIAGMAHKEDGCTEPRIEISLHETVPEPSADEISLMASTQPAPISSIFADRTIARAIAELFERPVSAQITQAELNMIGWVEIIGHRVQNLRGLQFLNNLELLILENNQISNLNHISGLTRLVLFCVCNNQVRDISALRNLRRLEFVCISDNHVADLRPLSGASRLQYLFALNQTITGTTTQVTGGIATVDNIVRRPNASRVAPFRISNGGSVQGNNIRWTGLAGSLQQVTYDFSDGGFSGRVTISLSDTPFSDVRRGQWHHNDINFAYGEGLVTGSGGRFRPNNNFTRAEAVTIFARMAGVDLTVFPATRPFPDVPAGNWAAPAVAWASDIGLVEGRPVGGQMIFAPGSPISRQEFAAMVARFAELVLDIDTSDFTVSPQWNGFTDRNRIQAWAVPYLQWANANGIVTGLNNPSRINPRGTTTRAEGATMVARFTREFL